MDDVHLGILMPTMYISRALYSIPGVSRLPKSIRGGGGRSLTLMDLRAAEGQRARRVMAWLAADCQAQRWAVALFC